MAITSSVGRVRPLLGAVFGPLAAAQDGEIRKVLQGIDDKLLALARHFGHEGAGWEGTGLDLHLLESGQVSLSSFVEACVDGSRCVSFCVDLRPAWYFGELSSDPAWDVEAEIYADCQHEADHRQMHLVHAVPGVRTTSPQEAAAALRATVDELVRLATGTTIQTWLRLAGDGRGPDQPR